MPEDRCDSPNCEIYPKKLLRGKELCDEDFERVELVEFHVESP